MISFSPQRELPPACRFHLQQHEIAEAALVQPPCRAKARRCRRRRSQRYPSSTRWWPRRIARSRSRCPIGERVVDERAGDAAPLALGTVSADERRAAARNSRRERQCADVLPFALVVCAPAPDRSAGSLASEPRSMSGGNWNSAGSVLRTSGSAAQPGSCRRAGRVVGPCADASTNPHSPNDGTYDMVGPVFSPACFSVFIDAPVRLAREQRRRALHHQRALRAQVPRQQRGRTPSCTACRASSSSDPGKSTTTKSNMSGLRVEPRRMRPR